MKFDTLSNSWVLTSLPAPADAKRAGSWAAAKGKSCGYSHRGGGLLGWAGGWDPWSTICSTTFIFTRKINFATGQASSWFCQGARQEMKQKVLEVAKSQSANALSQTMHRRDLEDDLLDPLVEQEIKDNLLQGCSVPLSPCHVLRVPVLWCHGCVPSRTPPCLTPPGFVWALVQRKSVLSKKKQS